MTIFIPSHGHPGPDEDEGVNHKLVLDFINDNNINGNNNNNDNSNNKKLQQRRHCQQQYQNQDEE